MGNKKTLTRQLVSDFNSLSNAGILSFQDLTILRACIKKIDSGLQKNNKPEVKKAIVDICKVLMKKETSKVGKKKK